MMKITRDKFLDMYSTVDNTKLKIHTMLSKEENAYNQEILSMMNVMLDLTESLLAEIKDIQSVLY